MDKAYLFMAIAFGASFVLGLLTAKTWIPVSLSTMAPSIAALVFYGLPAGKDIGPLFALVGPFLFVGTIWYAIIGFAGARLAGRVRTRLEKTRQTEADD